MRRQRGGCTEKALRDCKQCQAEGGEGEGGGRGREVRGKEGGEKGESNGRATHSHHRAAVKSRLSLQLCGVPNEAHDKLVAPSAWVDSCH